MSIAINIQMSYCMNRDCFVSRSEVILSYLIETESREIKCMRRPRSYRCERMTMVRT